jgi:carboxylesterase type B
MGESAGAGSIVHHLTAFGGKQKVLFNRAIIQSPGYSVHTWDRKGINEETYKMFLGYAGCANKGIECLRSVPFRKIKFAQDETIKKAVEGTFVFGPSVDGTWVRQLPQLELISGNYAKGLESLIVTHVTDEANMFTRRDRVYNDTNFRAYLNWSYGNNSAITNSLIQYYELDKYQDGRSRLMDYTMHSSFTCTTRFVAGAYPNITYMALFEGMHGSDLAADFFDSASTTGKLSTLFTGSNSNEKYQLYLMSYAQSGSPNKFKSPDTPDWEKIKYGDVISNVMEITNRFRLIRDFQTTKTDCDILTNAYAAATAEAGE